MRSPLRVAATVALIAGAAEAQYEGTFATTIKSTSPISTLQSNPGDPGTTTLYANYLNAYPEAVCNDGSPAAYYMSKGTGTGENTWLVYLEGSMFCWDQDSCDERSASKNWWMSSSNWKSDMAQGGIFSNLETESPFYNANLIWLKYCSSDLWNGDADASDATFGFYFKGFEIIMATIRDLVATHGMGSTAGGRLLFGGCSAGGIGAMNALDTVASMVPAGLKVQGLLDAAALLNIDTRDSGWPWADLLIPLQNNTAKLLSFDNPQLPQSCIDKYPDAIWKCTWGSFRLPMIQTPYFMTASQFDSFEISYDCDNYVPSTPQQTQFVDSFQTAALQLFSEVPADTAIYSSTCLTHCLTDQSIFYTFTVNGITPHEAVREWFMDSENVRVISTCQGYACTNQCGINNEGLPCNMGTSTCQIYPGPTEGAYPPPGPQQQGDPNWHPQQGQGSGQQYQPSQGGGDPNWHPQQGQGSGQQYQPSQGGGDPNWHPQQGQGSDQQYQPSQGGGNNNWQPQQGGGGNQNWEAPGQDFEEVQPAEGSLGLEQQEALSAFVAQQESLQQG